MKNLNNNNSTDKMGFCRNYRNNLTLTEMRRQNEMWFSEGAMRFFNSEIETKAHLNFFVTSEVFEEHNPNYPRLYSVRYFANGTNKVETIGNFQQFETKEEAETVAKKLGLLFEVIRLGDCYLENEIIKNVSYSSFENGIYTLSCIIEDEYKNLKLNIEDIKNMTFTF